MEMWIVKPQLLQQLVIDIIFAIFLRTFRKYFFFPNLSMDRGSPTLPTKTMPTMISNYRHMRLTIDTISFILGNLIIWIRPNKCYSRIVRVKKIVE